MSNEGLVLSSDIAGTVRVRCMLSGMPDLKLGLSDQVIYEGQAATSSPNLQQRPKALPTSTAACTLEDIRFHQCVRLDRFDSERNISFIPPDGEFDLMTYKQNIANTQPILWLERRVDKSKGNLHSATYTLKTQFNKENANASSIRVNIPVPADAIAVKTRAESGHAKHVAARSAVTWKISFLPGGRECSCSVDYKLPLVINEEGSSRISIVQDTGPAAPQQHPRDPAAPSSQRPISVQFEIPYFTLSGMQVKYLKVMEKGNYTAIPWVRYITENGNYIFR